MKTSLALLISTTCQRLGLGLFIFALIADSFLGMTLPMNIIAFISLVTLGIGGLASAAHLGRPLRFFNAFSNFKSHLTQEALITPFLGLALLVCSVNGYFYTLSDTMFTVMLWISFFLSIAFLVSTGLVYQLDARPAWDTPLVLIIFLTTAAQAGSLFASALSVGFTGVVGASLITLTWLMFACCLLAQYLFVKRLKTLGYGTAVSVYEQPYRNAFVIWLGSSVLVAASYAYFVNSGMAAAAYAAVLLSVIGIVAWTILFYNTSLLIKKFPQYPVDLNTYF